MLSQEEIYVLGQIIDTTWGKSSVLSPTMSVKCNLVGEDRLRVIFTTLGTFASETHMSHQTARLENEADKVTDSYLTKLKTEFKDQMGRALKTEVLSSRPSVEIVSLQPHISPRRTAYYRKTTIIKVV